MSIRLRSFLSVLFTLGVLYPPTVFGALVNVTVDDQNLDPVTEESISYEGPWDRQPGCLECTAKPDPLRAYDGTWHDASFDVNSSSQLIVPNATFSFIGTLISRIHAKLLIIVLKVPRYTSLGWLTTATASNSCSIWTTNRQGAIPARHLQTRHSPSVKRTSGLRGSHIPRMCSRCKTGDRKQRNRA